MQILNDRRRREVDRIMQLREDEFADLVESAADQVRSELDAQRMVPRRKAAMDMLTALGIVPKGLIVRELPSNWNADASDDGADAGEKAAAIPQAKVITASDAAGWWSGFPAVCSPDLEGVIAAGRSLRDRLGPFEDWLPAVHPELRKKWLVVAAGIKNETDAHTRQQWCAVAARGLYALWDSHQTRTGAVMSFSDKYRPK